MKLLRQSSHDPRQLALQLDFLSADTLAPSAIDHPAPSQAPKLTSPPPLASASTTPTSDALNGASKGKRSIQFDNYLLEYTLVRSKRRSIGFMIGDDGLRLTAPRWVTVVEIENAIREKQRWIFTKLTERRERTAQRLQPQMQWCDGATLPYLGADIILRILATQSAGISFDTESRELTVCLPAGANEQQLKDRVQGWLQLEAKRIFAERLPLYAEKLEVRYLSFSLSSAMTQWGSCTVEGKIRLNWRLIHFSLPLIDYVIAHELAHLREMNHGPRFWSTVQSVFPEFQAAKKALRERTPDTLPIF